MSNLEPLAGFIRHFSLTTSLCTRSGWLGLFDEAVHLGILSEWKQASYELSHEEKRVYSGVQATLWGGRTCPSDLCYFEPGCWGDLPDTEEAPQEDNQTQDMIELIFMGLLFQESCLELKNCLAPCTTTHSPELSGPWWNKRSGTSCELHIDEGQEEIQDPNYPKEIIGRALEMRNKLRIGRLFGDLSSNGGEGDLGARDQEAYTARWGLRTSSNLANWRKDVQTSQAETGQWLQPRA